MISLPTGRMKSREGNVVDADDIMSEVISLAKKEVIVRHPEISVKEADMRARSIGMAALKFFILKYDNTTSFVYNPEESLSFEGDTGPYVQYAYARICSIMKKAVKKSRSADFSLLTSQQEISLLNALNTFPEAVENAAKSYRPSIIARYALDLAQKFNEFYHSCQILKEEEKIMTARLTLCRAVQQVLRNSFHILNIDACEEM